MTRLIIVRHAESAFNYQNRIQGHLDSKLTVRGLRQARCLGERLRYFKIDKVYSSDLGRAYSTTMAIAKYRNLPIICDPLLREVHLGAWEGRTPEEVDKLYDKGYQKWLKKPSSIRIPRAETIAAFRKRVTSRVAVIAKRYQGKTVLVVTHGGVITALLAHWLHANFDHLIVNLQIDNTSLTIVDATEKHVRLRCINDASHLLEKDRHDFNVFNKRS